MHEIVVAEGEAAKTLAAFLTETYPIGYVRKVFRKSAVRINGRRAKESDLVRGGDRIQLFIPFVSREKPSGAGEIPIETIFEDAALLVLNKPAGIAVHEGRTVSKAASLLGALERRLRPSGIRPKLVHRLDKDTSGLLIVAKNDAAAQLLIGAFEANQVVKEYACLVAGRVPLNEGAIDFPLPGREGRPVRALTRYRIVQRFSDVTLARVMIETGRLHQIRLHFAKLGFPVVLDEQHGDFGFNKRFRREYGLKRQFLHAEKLRLFHAGKLRVWRAPLAPDLQQVLGNLAKRSR